MFKRNLFAVLVVLSFLLAGCAPATAPTPAAKATAPSKVASPAAQATPAAKPAAQATPAAKPASPAISPTAKPSGEQPRSGGILTSTHFVDPPSYDPIQEGSVSALVLVLPSYSAIVQHDPFEPAKVVGDLAEKWEMSPDGKSYTFSLVKNVKWHDGRAFTSEDARFGLELIRKPPQGIISPRKEWLKAVDKIETPDKDTLKITLQYPSPSFIHNLGDGRIVIVPKHVVDAKANMKKDVVGTGPYKFKSHDAGVSYSVAKNPDYFVKGLPYLDGITWYVIRDVATRFAALRTHQANIPGWGSTGLTPGQGEIIRKELSDKLEIRRHSSLIFQGLWLLQTKPPFNDIKVRRAISMALDRPKVVSVAAEGVGEVGGYVQPGGLWELPKDELMKMPGYRQPKDADIAEARKLLAEAGFAQGFKTTGVTRTDTQYERSMLSVKEQLAPIGIDVTVTLTDATTMMDRIYKRNYDMAIQFASAGFDDPDQFFGTAFVTGVPNNLSGFSDPEFDKAYDEQSRMMDPAKRKEMAFKMQRRLHELLPATVLYWFVYEIAWWKEVKNFGPGIGIYNNLKLQNVWLAK